MSMKSKKAIKVLRNYLKKLNSIKNVQEGNNWKASIKDILEQYGGPNSSITNRLDDLHFTRKESKVFEHSIGYSIDHIYDESKKENFRDLIENAISVIESNGIYKKSK